MGRNKPRSTRTAVRERVRRVKEIDVFRALHDHDASRVLQELGDAMITGHTGTNVNDLRLLLVG